MSPLSSTQLEIVEAPLGTRLFLEGPAMCGKTTAGVERLLHLMARGVPAGRILVLTPQRTLAQPYLEALSVPGVTSGGQVTLLTVGGLAQRVVDLFWPLAAGPAGFAHPSEPPVFLTLETAQYYMAHLVQPLLDEQRYFDGVTIERGRLYSQVIDNLNKAAVVGFPLTEIAERLQAVQTGEERHGRVYADAQDCALRFRRFCLEHNLLDFSLQMEVFRCWLWPDPLCRAYLQDTYRHLLVDNLEEDTPAAHDLLAAWLPACDSALLIYDQLGGLRTFLGADPETAYALKALCPAQKTLDESFIASPPSAALQAGLALALAPAAAPGPLPAAPPGSLDLALDYSYHRFYPQMLDWSAETVAQLVHAQGLPPQEIVILAPFVSDALRYALLERLERRGVPARAHRPSRPLRDEPAAQALLTLAALAHPAWGLRPSRFDVAYALVQAVAGLDLVRAQVLVEAAYRPRDGLLLSFDGLRPAAAGRITYRLGGRYERLRAWLEAYAAGEPAELDHFWARLFGELLSQPGFGFHSGFTGGEVTANLIESARKFRQAAGRVLAGEGRSTGQEYLAMVQDGLIAAQYLLSWSAPAAESVLVAPAYTFLMSNRPVEVQFWLDVGGRAWIERLYQPLTHPHVLSRRWQAGRPWTYEDENQVEQQALQRLALGLLRRCRGRLYLGLCELNEQGGEERGPLLQAFGRLLQAEG